MFRKFLITILLFTGILLTSSNSYAARNCLSLSDSDLWTFKEYCYKITDSFLDLRNKYRVDWVMDPYIIARISNYSKTWLLYLPDSLSNKNYYTHLKTSLEKWIKYPEDSSVFEEIETTIDDFLHKTKIQEISWKINVYPKVWNAPLTVTLRWDVKDPSWSKLENYNYKWWTLEKWIKKIIWNKVFLRHTFREEGNYSIFLDVTSNHKNKKGNTDVLSFSRQAEIEVKEKIASTIIRINWKRLGSKSEMKFSPQESVYGLLIDATSSTPTSWTKFVKTEWDFWNGVEKEYDWQPRVERVVYASAWTYKVILKMKTNTGRTVEREFTLYIRDPIATIQTTSSEWFLWDKFTFKANPTYKDDNLTFSWEIIDLKKDKVILNNASSVFTYSFNEKWRYNVKLEVTSPSWEKDYDNKIIYINSRAPVADFTTKIPSPNKPNTLFLDWSMSYDLDFSDDGKLEYSWLIDWDRVKLDNPNKEWSNWYYTFSSIWEHTVVLEVIDPDDMISSKKKKVNVASLLGVDFHMYPRVSQVWKIVKLVWDSPNARFFEWDFWDGNIVWWKNGKITHKFQKAWVYNVTLKVSDKDDKTNSFSKKMYVWDANNPYAHISVKTWFLWVLWYEKNVCNWNGAYIIDRVNPTNFSAEESIDVTGKNTWLRYSWKIWNKYYNTKDITKKFDELGCFKVKLTVRSEKTWWSSTEETYIKVINQKPSLSSLDIKVKDIEADPVIVDVKAIWAKDEDGIIQSYLWYYYTDSTTDPQDFRATKSNSTTFVLPKVSWTYYFVSVLKDNNEERFNSDDGDSKYSITLAWDNINTPIVSLKLNNSSISVWEEVIFTANAENIMTKNINKSSRFYWDFDWDWFYDKETTSNTVTHKYNRSWEMRAKVKVSHKWFSNTRTAIVNVSNILKPDFDYVSIWDKFVFFNETTGSISKYYWSMWDWKVLNKKGSFVYQYEDKKPAHIVKLKVSDWAKTKENSKKVTRNFSNFISVKQKELNIFSNYKIKNDKITLKEDKQNLLFYITTNLKDVKNYAIDYDVNSDSDLNWWNDDDKDNKDNQSFYSGWPAKVYLNWFRDQEIKVFLLWESWEILATKNLKIVKEYIEKEPIKTDDITFEWIPDSVKEKFEKIKKEVDNFPKEYKIKGLEYIQKLKEEWNDKRAKTNIILEFEWFIEESKITDTEDLIKTLELLLVDWPDSTQREIQLKALKNLIPKDIVCSEDLKKELKDSKTCYVLLLEKLDAIFESYSVEENEILWKQIWPSINNSSKMTKKEKKDFWAIMKTLVYWKLEEIPEDQVWEVVWQSSNWSSKKSTISSTLLYILKILFYIIIWVWAVIWLFFLWYKFFNENKEKWFTDFISEKTSWETKVDNTEIEEKDEFDPLADFSDPLGENKNTLEEEKSDMEKIKDISANKEILDEQTPDWLKWNLDEENNKSQIITEEKKDTQKDDISKEDEDLVINSWVPNWLKWSLDEETKEDKQEEVKQEKKEIKAEVPFEEKKETLEKTSLEEEPKLQTKEELDDFTEIKDESENKEETDDNIPDWLKWSLDEAEEKKEVKKEELKEEDDNKPKEKSEEVKSEKKPEKAEEKKQKEEPKKEKKEETKKTSKTKVAKTEKKTTSKKTNQKPKTKKEDKSDKKITKDKATTEEPKTTKKTKDDELWDDGMKVPDWLKTDE